MTPQEYLADRPDAALWYTSTAVPAGEELPACDPDVTWPGDEVKLLGLDGDVTPNDVWVWWGEGRPTDWRGNSITDLRAYPS